MLLATEPSLKLRHVHCSKPFAVSKETQFYFLPFLFSMQISMVDHVFNCLDCVIVTEQYDPGSMPPLQDMPSCLLLYTNLKWNLRNDKSLHNSAQGERQIPLPLFARLNVLWTSWGQMRPQKPHAFILSLFI